MIHYPITYIWKDPESHSHLSGLKTADVEGRDRVHAILKLQNVHPNIIIEE